jgi:hypothetical protein
MHNAQPDKQRDRVCLRDTSRQCPRAAISDPADRPAETWAWCIMDGILALLEVSVVIAESGSADNCRLEF